MKLFFLIVCGIALIIYIIGKPRSSNGYHWLDED